jgi:hypothetical protein
MEKEPAQRKNKALFHRLSLRFFLWGEEEETRSFLQAHPTPPQFSRAPTIHAHHFHLDKETHLENETATQDAEEAESSGSPVTARAMVAAVVSLGVEDADRERTWLADAADLTKRGSFACAREVAAAALGAFPGKPGVWRAAVAVEKAAAAGAGDAGAAAAAEAAVDALLQKAVSYCPEVSLFLLFLSFGTKSPPRGLLNNRTAARKKSIKRVAVRASFAGGKY